MSRLLFLFSLIVPSLSVVPFKNRSTEGNYQLKTKSLEVTIFSRNVLQEFLFRAEYLLSSSMVLKSRFLGTLLGIAIKECMDLKPFCSRFTLNS